MKATKTMTGVVLLISALVATVAAQENRVSKLGQYSGFSKPLYSEWIRTSQYIVATDGTKLAADIFRPSEQGHPITEKLPVIWTHTRYQRSHSRNGKLETLLDRAPRLQTLLKYGYVVTVVDVRGSGASFGTWGGSFSPKETRDAYDITEWLAAQPWCNGKVGMFGPSYLGATQYMAASQAPPHLKAIFPQKAPCDRYALLYPGGVFRKDFSEAWGRGVKDLDVNLLPSPVDEDKSGALLEAARNEHKANRGALEMTISCPFRDSLDPRTQELTWLARSTFSHLDAIKQSKVAVYHLGGWFDCNTRDTVICYKNLNNPQKLVIGPWTHQQDHELDLGIEHLRWFDYWLKSVDNGIMKEPPIHYYTLRAPQGLAWRAAAQWPLPQQHLSSFFFYRGPAGSVKSANDGTLVRKVPADESASDIYAVDYRTTSGKPSRWSSGYGLGGKEFNYPDMTSMDEKGLTYTTAPLSADMEVTGHPVIHLWITASAKDADFFAYLEDVDAKGISHYVTEGTLRVSHRALHEPPYEYLGLPYHRSYAADVAALPDKPVEIAFDLQPTSIVFHQAHRIRVTITCADKDNTVTPELDPPPRVSIHRGKQTASHIVLPIIPAK